MRKFNPQEAGEERRRLGVSVLRGRSRGRESTQGSLHRHDRYVQDCATTTIVRYGSGRLARTAWNVSLVRIIGRLRRFVESFTRTIPIQRSIVNGHVDDVKTEYSHDHVPIHESLLGYCSPGPRSAHGRTRDGCFPIHFRANSTTQPRSRSAIYALQDAASFHVQHVA